MPGLALRPFRLYAAFSGRASRREYWLFIAFQMLVSLVFLVVASYLAHHRPAIQHPGVVLPENVMGGVWLGYLALTALPYLAVTARRLHDLGQSGWWSLMLLVPVIGPAYVLLQVAQRGQAGDNAYGPVPAR